MSAIINVAGNYKDGEDIGTFGIGFKILHRLVGADDGREAIINDYAGPIIFSWNNYFQLKNLLKENQSLFLVLEKQKKIMTTKGTGKILGLLNFYIPVSLQIIRNQSD